MHNIIIADVILKKHRSVLRTRRRISFSCALSVEAILVFNNNSYSYLLVYKLSYLLFTFIQMVFFITTQINIYLKRKF